MNPEDHPVIDTDTPLRRILEYLYCHPGKEESTNSLIAVLHPEVSTSELGAFQNEQFAAWLEEAQTKLESLLLDRLVKGKRALQNGIVIHTELELTAKGEEEAIRSRREPKKIILDL